jgi:quercetin dioxygenase-like cupin family protein
MSEQFERASDEQRAQTVVAYSSVPMAQLAPGAHSHIMTGEKMTLSFAHLEAGSYFPVHTHPYEQMMVVLKGELDAVLEGKLYRMGPGDVIFFPEGLVHGAQMRDVDCEILDVFTPARPDYIEKMRQARAAG